MPDRSDDFVSIAEIERVFGLDRSNTRKALLKICERLGIVTHQRRTPSTRGQRTLCVTRPEWEKILAHRSQVQGFGIGEAASSARPVASGIGVFYVLQMVPELDPNRVKLGYTESTEARFADHRTASPTAKFVKKWPCKSIWERAAMDSATRIGTSLIANEVFVVEDLTDLIDCLDQFFALMPEPDDSIPLSEHSPLRSSEPI